MDIWVNPIQENKIRKLGFTIPERPGRGKVFYENDSLLYLGILKIFYQSNTTTVVPMPSTKIPSKTPWWCQNDDAQIMPKPCKNHTKIIAKCKMI